MITIVQMGKLSPSHCPRSCSKEVARRHLHLGRLALPLWRAGGSNRSLWA